LILIAIDYIFEVIVILNVIVIGHLGHYVVGNCNWYVCNQLPITISLLCQWLQYQLRWFLV